MVTVEGKSDLERPPSTAGDLTLRPNATLSLRGGEITVNDNTMECVQYVLVFNGFTHIICTHIERKRRGI